jgi:T-complex protein 1 subunit theta
VHALKHASTPIITPEGDSFLYTQKQVTKALRSAIAAKQYGLEDFLAPLVAKACIQILPKNPSDFNVDNVRVAKIPGMTVTESFLMKGYVLTRDSEGTVKHVNNAKIVVFGTEVDLSAPESKGNVLIKNAEASLVLILIDFLKILMV